MAATRRVRGSWPIARTAAFLAGVGAALLALESGVERYDAALLSAHMLQHMLLLLVAPLLLLLGRPLELALRAAAPSARPRIARALGRLRGVTGPLMGLTVFSAVVLFTHLPGFYDATLRHSALHDLEHGLYLLAGTLMWWALLDVDPLQRGRLSGLGKLLYLVVSMMPMAIIGAYLDRQPTLVYAAYASPAHALGVSALTDQAYAGAIMWVLGDTVMVAVGLWAAVSGMVLEERRAVARERRALVQGPPTGGSSRPQLRLRRRREGVRA